MLRQLAVLRWLQQRHPHLALRERSATTGLPAVVDLKEAVRLGLGARLHALTGLPISQVPPSADPAAFGGSRPLLISRTLC